MTADDERDDEYEGGVLSPPEGEQDESHESDETLSPDEKSE